MKLPAWGLATLAVVLCFAACTSDPEPSPAPPPSPIPEVAPSAIPSPLPTLTGTPAPPSAPPPEPSPTPEPTATATSAPTPPSTATSITTATPIPTATAAATAALTAIPTATATASPTAIPTATPAPALTIVSTDESRWTFLDTGDAILDFNVAITKSGDWGDTRFELRVECPDRDGCAKPYPVNFDERPDAIVVRATVRLAPGTSDLNLRLAPAGEGSVSDAMAETRIRVAAPETPGAPLRIDSHEVASRGADGTAVVSFVLALPDSIADPSRPADWLVRCLGDVFCDESGKLVAGESGPGQRVVQVSLPHGEREIYLEVSKGKTDGVEVVHAIERYPVDLSPASAPVVEFGGYEVVSYNDDGTANLVLEFLAQEAEDWSYTSLVAQVSCAGEVVCSGQQDTVIDWSKAEGRHRFEVEVKGVPTGDVALDASFDGTGSDWSRRRDAARLLGIELTLYPQPEIELMWHDSGAEVLGYFMDGSALVRVSSRFSNTGSADEGTVAVERICLNSAELEQECWQPAVSVSILPDGGSGSVQLGDFKLPQGKNELIVDAGESSSMIEIEVEAKIVGITRDLWECFKDRFPVKDTTCGGFQGERILKWELDRVFVYREGDPEYVRIFDESLFNMGEVLGIEYVIVDDRESTHIEAYLGHEGHPRLAERMDAASIEALGSARWWSSAGSESFDGGLISVRKRYPHPGDDEGAFANRIRLTTVHELSHVLIPMRHDSRPFSLYRLVRPYYLRESDLEIYRMIYSPLVRAGMTYDEVEALMVFAEDTLDHEPERDPDVELLAHKARKLLQFSDAIRLNMSATGACSDQSPAVPRNLTVAYWRLGYWESQNFMVEQGSRSSLGFDYRKEVWHNTETGWRNVEDDWQFFDQIGFDPYKSDPSIMLLHGLIHADDLSLSSHSDGKYILRTHKLDPNHWPKIEMEIVLDDETGRMSAYKARWEDDPEYGQCRFYHIDAEVLSYGEYPEVPEDVKSQSTFAAVSGTGCWPTVETSLECIALLELQDELAGDATLNWRKNVDIRQWEGVGLGGWPYKVHSLELDSKGLDGTIPTGMSKLTELRRIDLQNNELTGEIPAELGELQFLEELTLGNNQLTGAVPEEIGELLNLNWLDISDNQISGCVPIDQDRTDGFLDGLPTCAEVGN